MENITAPTAEAPQVIYVEKKSNGWGTASLVLGILALTFSWIPLLNMVSIPLALVALAVGIGGLVKARKIRTGMVKTVIGMVLALVSVGTFFVVTSATVNAVDEAVTSIEEAMNVSDKVDIVLGTPSSDEFGTTLPVTITNTSVETVSPWVTVAATSPDGSEQYETSSVIVNDLDAGQKATEDAVFIEDLPADAVFTITDVM